MKQERRYIFLDNWVLSKYTDEEKSKRLGDFVRRNQLTILITSLMLTELFNPRGRHGDRVTTATRFLAGERCVIVSPEAIFRAELQSYPEPLADIPLDLDLDDLVAAHRGPVLDGLLRRHEVFLFQGKDVGDWASKYADLKASWLQDIERIINRACDEGTLHRDSSGRLTDLESTKEEFLASLDRRHFGFLTSEERKALGANIIDLFMGRTSVLPAIRLNSLLFWYAYVDLDCTNLLKRKGSDIGDLLHMSMIPYCSFFTADSAMCRLLQRVGSDRRYSCTILTAQGLDRELGLAGGRA